MTSLWNTALGDTGVPFQMGEPLSRHTTFRIGGAAEYYASPKSIPELERLLAACRTQGIPYFILGKGSNLLVGDRGIPGLTIAMEGLSAITVEGERVTAQGGASLMAVCAAARQAGLAGLEFAYGIPGQVGGGVYMNAGAYGGEMKQVLSSVTAWLPGAGIRQLSLEELDLGYRHSVFSGTRGAVLEAELLLEPGNPEAIQSRMADFDRRRREKQPLEYPSAGSVFKRPEGHFAGGLIEQCGLKGFRIGGAQVSEKHAGFIVNTGGAACADVLALIAHIRKTVYDQTGVNLEPEVRTVP